MNETASKDPVVRAALDAMARRNFETLEVPAGGTWYISDRHQVTFFLVALVILGGWVIGDTAIKSMKEVTNQRNAQLCQIDPTLCQSTK